MAGGRWVATWRAWLVGAAWLMACAGPANASTILVREELGFSFLPSGTQWVLEEDGASVIYDLTSQFGAGALFDLRYAHDMFIMTALADNTVASEGSLPFGLDVYPGNVTPISPAYDCLVTDPCYNGFGFLAWLAFPLAAGDFVGLAIPQTAVAEPASWALLVFGLGMLVWTRSRARARLLNGARPNY